MSNFKIGDIVVLTAGSMRMAVEEVKGDKVSTVWCNEGEIGRDIFNTIVLKKWEHREDDRAKNFRGTGRNNDRSDDRDGRRDEKPKGKTGWDGKPREKKFFRKD